MANKTIYCKNPAIWEAVTKLASSQGRSVSEIIESALADYIATGPECNHACPKCCPIEM
jgi:hypothetical protein